MSAADDFPRGAFLSSGGVAGAAASVTFPALPGIAWTLTQANGVVYQTATMAGGPYSVELLANAVDLGSLTIPTSAVQGDNADISWSGQLAFPINTAVIVAFSVNTTGYTQDVNASAYPT